MLKRSIRQRAEKVPVDIKLFVNKSMSTARLINTVLERQGKTQRDLAVLLGKKESEISKWMQGTHNFTFKTICKIEAVLGEQLIFTNNHDTQRISIYRVIDKSTSFKAFCIDSHTNGVFVAKHNNQNFSVTSSSAEKINPNIFSKSCLLN